MTLYAPHRDDDTGLDYLLRDPAQGTARQLVVLLHGFGRNGLVMEKAADAIADIMPHARLILPHAPERCDRDGNGILMTAGAAPPPILRAEQGRAALLDRRQWFSLRGPKTRLPADILAMADRLNRFIDNQRDAAGLTDQDIALVGFSQGGSMAFYTAYTRPRPVRCVVAHSTLFMPLSAPAMFTSTPPTLYLYGTADEEFPLSIFHDGIKYLHAAHIPLTVNAVAGLSHRTSSHSRWLTARYVARQWF